MPYGKPSERYVSILGGHVDLLYEQAGDVKAFLGNKQMRPMLSVTAERFPLYKEMPTVREQGYDITVPQIRWVYMKAGTDPARVKVIADSLERMSRTQEFKEYLSSEYADPESFVPPRRPVRHSADARLGPQGSSGSRPEDRSRIARRPIESRR